MTSAQPGILAPVPRAARYLTYRLGEGAHPEAALRRLAARSHPGESLVVGLGHATVARLGRAVPSLRELPPLAGPGASIPSTPAALWIWLRGDDPGELLHLGRQLTQLLDDAFVVDSTIDAFRYAGGRDLTGYEDGTENPKDGAAEAAAILSGAGPGLDGSSFVAVQRWRHALARFEAMPERARDATIGRSRDENLELVDAPSSAHVKRAAQESFEPAAFMVRRSMPWADAVGEGLVFVAFGRSFDAFEAVLRRMVGLEDGIVDALFGFTHPTTGSYFWCPPLRGGYLDLSALGIDAPTR